MSFCLFDVTVKKKICLSCYDKDYYNSTVKNKPYDDITAKNKPYYGVTIRNRNILIRRDLYRNVIIGFFGFFLYRDIILRCKLIRCVPKFDPNMSFCLLSLNKLQCQVIHLETHDSMLIRRVVKRRSEIVPQGRRGSR